MKRKMKDYGGALEDLNKANKLAPNDNFTLQEKWDVKKMMNNYFRALADLNKADKLAPIDDFILK